MLEKSTIYNADCLDAMKELPDKSIDMILCDLPYAQTSSSWDVLIPFDALWKQYNRVIKDNGAICLTAKGKFLFQLVNSNLKDYRYEWIWDKNKGSNFAHAKRRPLNVHEYVVIFYKKQPTYNPQMTEGKPYTQTRLQESVTGIADNLSRHTTVSNGLRYPKSIIRTKGIAQRHIIHPTQKPLGLFEYLIKTYSNENDVVLDNCMGSFTTAVACDNLNRQWIGIEKEEKYCLMGQERINDNRKHLHLEEVSIHKEYLKNEEMDAC